jgi:hypothetical protein
VQGHVPLVGLEGLLPLPQLQHVPIAQLDFSAQEHQQQVALLAVLDSFHQQQQDHVLLALLEPIRFLALDHVLLVLKDTSQTPRRSQHAVLVLQDFTTVQQELHHAGFVRLVRLIHFVVVVEILS